MDVSPIYIGAMHVTIIIPDARSLKDKRRAIKSLTDKINSRFQVSCNLLGEGEHPGRQRIVLTSAGKELGQVKKLFDKVRFFLDSFDRAWPGRVDIKTFSWCPSVGTLEFLDG